jgi:hypothetical protein
MIRQSSKLRLILVTALALTSMIAVACSGGGDEDPTVAATTALDPTRVSATSTSVSGSSGGSGTGTLEVRVTDAPDPSITAVYVTTDDVQVSVDGSGWETVIDEEITFELLALEGVEAILGEADLPVGRYTQVRLSVPEVEIEKNGEIVIAEVPSDTIRLVGTFELEEDTTTFISLDFDVDESLVDRQRQGFLFKPVIKLDVGEPGEEGSRPVDLPEKPDRPDTPAPTARPAVPTAVPTATPVPPTATPVPTATPDALAEFFLDILQPVDGEDVVGTDTYEIVGRTTVDALVSVNDDFVDVAVDGEFRSTVTLDEGPNIVEVVASTAAGDQSSIVLVIIYDPAA